MTYSFGASPAQDDNWPVTEIFKYLYSVVTWKDNQFLIVFTDSLFPLTRMKCYNNARLLCYWGHNVSIISIWFVQFLYHLLLNNIILFLICSCLMSPTEVPTSITGLTNITTTEPTTGTGLTNITTTEPTTGTEKGLSGEPSPSYKRKILDISKFSVSSHYLLHVV